MIPARQVVEAAHIDPLADILIGPDEVIEAARHRLRKWSEDRIAAGLAVMEAAQSCENGLQEVFAGLPIPEDRQEPFGAFCALLVLFADARQDWGLFYRAGHEVMRYSRQAIRATYPRDRGDALDRMILDYVAAMPEITPAELWRDFTQKAEDEDDDILLDFDGYAGELKFAKTVSGRGKDDEKIKYGAFRKRVQRARRHLPG